MGFFTDLKEDLSQAVNELAADEQAGTREKAGDAEQAAVADDFASEEEIWAENENWADEDWAEEAPAEAPGTNDMVERLSSMLDKLDEENVLPEEPEAKESTGMGILGMTAPGADEGRLSAGELMAETGLTEEEMLQMGLAVPGDISEVPEESAAADTETERLFDLSEAEPTPKEPEADVADFAQIQADEEMTEVSESESEQPEMETAESPMEDQPADDKEAETDGGVTAVDFLKAAEQEAVSRETETEMEAGGENRMLEETVTREDVTETETAEAAMQEETAVSETVPEEDAAEEIQPQRIVSDEVSVVTAGMKITGDVTSDGSMEVVGTVQGNIEIWGKLNVAGTVYGNSKAMEVYAENARIRGEVTSEGSVKIGQSSVIIGNIYATSAVIAGAVKGDIDVPGPVILDTTAIVMGNIKAKSVQINNGAVIEGMCSLVYADVNPTSFFEAFQ